MRIYNPEAELGKTIKLTKEQIRHSKALRLRPGEPIYVIDGKGKAYLAEEKVRGELVLKEELPKKPENEVTLAIAPVKGYRMDFLIEKATEIGVARIIPIITERTIVKPGRGKIERWRKIAIEACCQSGRARIPEISEPEKYERLITKVREYGEPYLCDIQGGQPEPTERAIMIVGPEGGFTAKEKELTEKAKIQKIKLSNSILRTETAGIIAVSKFASNT